MSLKKPKQTTKGNPIPLRPRRKGANPFKIYILNKAEFSNLKKKKEKKNKAEFCRSMSSLV